MAARDLSLCFSHFLVVSAITYTVPAGLSQTYHTIFHVRPSLCRTSTVNFQTYSPDRICLSFCLSLFQFISHVLIRSKKTTDGNFIQVGVIHEGLQNKNLFSNNFPTFRLKVSEATAIFWMWVSKVSWDRVVGLGGERSAVDFSKLGLRPAPKQNFQSSFCWLYSDVRFLMYKAWVAMII